VAIAVGTVRPTAPATAPGSSHLAPPASAPASVPTPASVTPPVRSIPVPAIWPVPQSMRADGPAILVGGRVALVSDASSDRAAISALQAVLTADGVRVVDHVSDTRNLSAGEPVFFVSGAETGISNALRLLNAPDATDLPSGGYVLADGLVGGHPSVVLDGHDGAGTFYAVQTLRQLVQKVGARSYAIPGVRIRDWPALPVRGVIEGFYGAPWSNAQRATQLAFYGRYKMNAYTYSPKDDVYLRAKWRDPYPRANLAALATLVRAAAGNHIRFTYALSPGLSICYGSASDDAALIAKLQSMWAIGVRSFSIPFDDISYTKSNCRADTVRFGTGARAAGDEQAFILNKVQRDFIDTHPGAEPLQTVATEYHDTAPSAYKTAMKNNLSPKVIVGWTGEGVVPAIITTAQARQAAAVYGHRILLWDNYPVNDYVPGRLLLGPVAGRSASLTTVLYGITANPMTEPQASRIALFTDADCMWNSARYDPERSWRAGIASLAGGSDASRIALTAFADLNRASRIDSSAAPALSARLARFWTAWKAGDVGAAASLDQYLGILRNIPATLKKNLDDPEFLAETRPWLNAAANWGTAMHDALSMLREARAGHRTSALTLRHDALVAEAEARGQARVDPETGRHVTVTLDSGIPAAFVHDALLRAGL
jgi:hyaluronoglucosaminidase